MKTAEGGRRRRLVSSSETSDLNERSVKSIEGRRSKIMASPGCLMWLQISSSDHVPAAYHQLWLLWFNVLSFTTPIPSSGTDAPLDGCIRLLLLG
jgi:hypothetical protein